MLTRVQSRISNHLGARAQYIWTRQFGQHYASQSLTNAADAQQKIAFRLQVAIIVDRQCDGFVDRSELAREVRDRRIGQGLSLRVDNAAVLAILPFRQAGDDARSDRLQLTQPTVGLRGWCPRRGFTILTNVRRIDHISLVAIQVGAASCAPDPPRTEPVREPEEVFLLDRVQDRGPSRAGLLCLPGRPSQADAADRPAWGCRRPHGRLHGSRPIWLATPSSY